MNDDMNNNMDNFNKNKFLLTLDTWDETVKKGINDFILANRNNNDNKDNKNNSNKKESCNAFCNPYVIFDFDNTCSIFDVEEQLAIYQLEVMAFALSPEELLDVLRTGISDTNKIITDYSNDNNNHHSYNDWIDDICNAYTYLYYTYGPFTAKGLDEINQITIQKDSYWLEFATKMRAMCDLIYFNDGPYVAYPWILYWFTGMTEEEVYDLAYRSHNTYKSIETTLKTWTSPSSISNKVGQVEYTWKAGIQVTPNIIELWQVLKNNGIDVYVCSASGVDTICAAIDTWDMRKYCDGVIAMTNVLKDGKYTNKYDYTNGCMRLVKDGEWIHDNIPIKSQTHGIGKVTAIQNALITRYNYGPIAAFMDSTGDFNLCTEFNSLQLALCFNTTSCTVTNGGGLISLAAIYENDILKYDFKTAQEANDIYFLLQGRNEKGIRTLINSRKTQYIDKEIHVLFTNDEIITLYNYIVKNNMTIKEIINTFSIKTNATDTNNDTKITYGFIDEYSGYKNIK